MVGVPTTEGSLFESPRIDFEVREHKETPVLGNVHLGMLQHAAYIRLARGVKECKIQTPMEATM